MYTGIYVRAKILGKTGSYLIEELPESELRDLFDGKSHDSLVNWLVSLVGMIRDD